MAKFRKKPVVVEGFQWFRNGDHPLDGMTVEWRREGAVVRSFRSHRPDCAPHLMHETCGFDWKSHGLIDTLEGIHIVCPGDWIITGLAGERYPIKPHILELTYDVVEVTDEEEEEEEDSPQRSESGMK